MGTNASVSSTKDRTIRTTVSQHKPRQPTKEKMKSTALAVGLAVGLAVATVSTCQAEKEETYLEAATHFCETMTTNNKQCGWVGMDDPRYQNDREVKINQIGCPQCGTVWEAGTKRMKRERGALSNIPRTPSSAQGLMEQATSRTLLCWARPHHGWPVVPTESHEVLTRLGSCTRQFTDCRECQQNASGEGACPIEEGVWYEDTMILDMP